MGRHGIDGAQIRFEWWAIVEEVMIFLVAQYPGNFLSSREPASFARRTVLHVVSWLVISFWHSRCFCFFLGWGISVIDCSATRISFKYDEEISLYVQLLACTEGLI